MCGDNNDFKRSGLSFEEINELNDKDLGELFLKPEERPIDTKLQTLLKLFPAMDKELRRQGVNGMVLWEDYIKKHPDGYRYSRFKYHFANWKARPHTHYAQRA